MANRLPQKSLEGRRIRLLICKDTHTKLEPGAQGTVSLVDSLGTVHVDWDNGSKLGLVWSDGDRWMVIPSSAVGATHA
jgi:urease beta subunit